MTYMWIGAGFYTNYFQGDTAGKSRMPSRVGMGLFDAAALVLTVTADWSRYFSQVSFISFPPVIKRNKSINSVVIAVVRISVEKSL